jgi:catechol 2,3-dioxygenase-like lactoylglutathione lyase family enzyme
MSTPSLAAPSFLAFVVDDVAAAAGFWTDVVGLEPAAQSPTGARVFQTSSIPFAVRVPRAGEQVGSGPGVAVWFSVKGDVDAFRATLLQRKANVSDVQDGPFGRMFILFAPRGYAVTVHAGAP